MLQLCHSTATSTCPRKCHTRNHQGSINRSHTADTESTRPTQCAAEKVCTPRTRRCHHCTVRACDTQGHCQVFEPQFFPIPSPQHRLRRQHRNRNHRRQQHKSACATRVAATHRHTRQAMASLLAHLRKAAQSTSRPATKLRAYASTAASHIGKLPRLVATRADVDLVGCKDRTTPRPGLILCCGVAPGL